MAVHFLHSIAGGMAPADADPRGILTKPIPEKLVGLTFDDGCRSHATIVAPILKRMEFGATFYVSDFDSFATRKDWYLTWRQMQALTDAGFEVGNHSKGHASFRHADVETCTRYLLAMEDDMLAGNIARPTTFCWPFYHVNADFFSVLAAQGHAFGRGGHSRAYETRARGVTDESIRERVSVQLARRTQVRLHEKAVSRAASRVYRPMAAAFSRIFGRASSMISRTAS